MGEEKTIQQEAQDLIQEKLKKYQVEKIAELLIRKENHEDAVKQCDEEIKIILGLIKFPKGVIRDDR